MYSPFDLFLLYTANLTVTFPSPFVWQISFRVFLLHISRRNNVAFCILYSECPPYFFFRFVSPIDLESIQHASSPTLIIPTMFEVDMTIDCRVTAFLSADTSRALVTLTFDLLILNSCHTWRVTWATLPPSLKTLRLFVHELRVITVPNDYRKNAYAATAHAPNHVTRK